MAPGGWCLTDGDTPDNSGKAFGQLLCGCLDKSILGLAPFSYRTFIMPGPNSIGLILDLAGFALLTFELLRTNEKVRSITLRAIKATQERVGKRVAHPNAAFSVSREFTDKYNDNLQSKLKDDISSLETELQNVKMHTGLIITGSALILSGFFFQLYASWPN